MVGVTTRVNAPPPSPALPSSVPGLQEKLYQEQVEAFKKLPGPLTIEHMQYMPILHACVRETLRLRPPIMSIMRKCREDITIVAEGKTYVVPKGSQVWEGGGARC